MLFEQDKDVRRYSYTNYRVAVGLLMGEGNQRERMKR